MNKPKYRYNWKTKEWDQLFTIDLSIMVPRGINPKTKVAEYNRIHMGDPLYDFYRDQINEKHKKHLDWRDMIQP